MSFAEQLKAERQRLSLTQAEAAAVLEIGKRTLEHWEEESRTPALVTQEGALARLARQKPKRTKS